MGTASEYQHLIISEVVIPRSDDLLARLQTFEHFIELRILTADADLALDCLVTVRGYYIYPFASGLLVECAARNKDCAFRLAELKIQIICLAGADIGRLVAAESEVCLELSVTHFGLYLADDSVICLVLALKSRCKTGKYTVNIMFIHLCLDLIAAFRIDLPDLASASD